MTLSSNNLFNYATSELSQDAFICWLLSFARRENEKIDPTLTTCARKFLQAVMPDTLPLADIEVTDIVKQYKHIDILVEINKKWHIIIEDKVFTGEHDAQISTYKKAIIEEYRSDAVSTVYYKIVEESAGNDADYVFNRTDLLKLFIPCKAQTTNQIFQDYVEYLEWIDAETKSWKTKDMTTWKDMQYRGFFSTLAKERTAGWGYVANKSGGFWGFWWYWWNQENLSNPDFPTDIREVYLQLENNYIVVKVSKAKNGDENKIQDFKWHLFKQMKAELQALDKDVDYQKSRFKQGEYMSVGSIAYDLQNYKARMSLMEKALQNVLKRGAE